MKKVFQLLGIVLLTSILGVCVVPHNVHATWIASPDAGAFYKIFRADGACPADGSVPANMQQIGQTAVGETAYTDNTVVAQHSYCYAVKASDPTNFLVDSVFSNTSGNVIPKDGASPATKLQTVVVP